MTILTGKRRADTMEMSGRMAKKAGANKFTASLFTAGSQGYGAWKGAKGKTTDTSTIDVFGDGVWG